MRDVKMLPWVNYDEAMAHLPQARWMAVTAARSNQRIAAVRVNDAEALLEAVLAGLGRSLLPCVIADRDSRLRRLGPRDGAPVLSRELWLLTHSDLRRLGRIEAVVNWIEQIAPR
jgi:DNA-binding transcriptional LysR family regulator